jgi:predicted transcriptional regulator
MAMSNKEAAIRAIQGLPDDASTEDIMYAMYVRAKIEEGLRDAEAGNLIDHETVKREINEWLRSAGRQ